MGEEIKIVGEKVPVIQLAPTLEDVFHLDEHIQYLRKELKKAEDEKRKIIEDHIKANLMQEGAFRLVDAVRRIRTLDVRKFRELYPNEFYDIADTSIPIMKAEAAIGKNKLDPLCTVTEQHLYSVEYVKASERK